MVVQQLSDAIQSQVNKYYKYQICSKMYNKVHVPFLKKKKKGMSQKLAQKKEKKNMSLFGMCLNNSF